MKRVRVTKEARALFLYYSISFRRIAASYGTNRLLLYVHNRVDLCCVIQSEQIDVEVFAPRQGLTDWQVRPCLAARTVSCARQDITISSRFACVSFPTIKHASSPPAFRTTSSDRGDAGNCTSCTDVLRADALASPQRRPAAVTPRSSISGPEITKKLPCSVH